MRARYSLRRRLLLWLLAPTLLFGALALLDTWREAVSTADTVSDRVLAGSALAIAERVVVSEDGRLEVDIPYVALEMLTSNAQDRVFYRVDGPSDAFITGYDKLPEAEGLSPERTVFADANFRGEEIRLAAISRSASTGAASIPFTVTVAETKIGRQQLANTILLRSAARMALLIIGAALIVWIAVTAALRPLEQLSREMARRNPEDMHPLDPNAPEEVGALVDALNSFMGRLGSALSGLRNFTGNASHQLRTPMTIVRTQLALASRADTPDAARSAIAKADDAVVQSERVLTQLMLLARIDEAASRSLTGDAVADLAEIARDVVADRVMKADAAGVDLGYEGAQDAPARGDDLLLRELLGNLVDNAVAYAGSGATVTVRARRDGDRSALEVEDDGPGIAPDQLGAVRQRFTRATGASPGSGLGLSIVEEITALLGGALHLGPGADGKGLLARVTLPAG